MPVVVVESPAKAKTINKYLGSGYTVLASYGHVRDLPSKDGSVDPDHGFGMTWEIGADSKKHVKAIADALKSDPALILATDPDREGEAISWHLEETLRARKALKADSPVSRVVFNAITKSAVTAAMAQPRQVDMELVEAYLARRALDYLVGFNLSPVLWRKLPGARSAGRVQSVCLRLITDREMEIEAFRAREYWTVAATLATPSGDSYTARLASLGGRKLDRFDIADEDAARLAVHAITSRDLAVTSVEAKPGTRNPSAPFMTSTLQQEASRKFGFGARQTMQAAQRLYEAGHITYMRTDGIDMAPEAVMAARDAIKARYGEPYVPGSPRMYKNKAKNAQEAHECIRPTDMGADAGRLNLTDADQRRLYDLIWKRTLASQMAAARLERTTVEIASADGQVGLRATGQVIQFDGFMKVYTEGRDEAPASDEDDDARLPQIAQGEAAAKARGHARAALHPAAAALHRGDAGQADGGARHRPALDLCLDRHHDPGPRLCPQGQEPPVPRGQGPPRHRLPRQLLPALRRIRLHLRPRGGTRRHHRGQARLEGRARPLLARLHRRAGGNGRPPHRRGPRQDQRGAGPAPVPAQARRLGPAPLPELRRGAAVDAHRALGRRLHRLLALSRMPLHPPVRPAGHGGRGRYRPRRPAPRHRRGRRDPADEGPLRPLRPARPAHRGRSPSRPAPALPQGWEPDTIDLDRALLLLSLPREVGPHPEDGEMITATIGRYGPYVKHGTMSASLTDAEEVFTVGMNRAVQVLAEKAASRGRGRTAVAPLRELGEHPGEGGPVQVMEGRYGPYVKWGKVNATLPKEITPEAVTMDQAVALIAEKASKGGKKAPRKAKPAAKKPAKKAAAKKPAAKKPAATKATDADKPAPKKAAG